MLSNAYFLAKFRFDTAENEPAKNLQDFAKFANFAYPAPFSRRATGSAASQQLADAVAERNRLFGARGVVANFWQIPAKFRSFSVVSAPIFSSQYAFCSILCDLPDYLAENFESWQFFADFATFAKCC